MENNRLYIVDKLTGGKFLLAKSFGAGWQVFAEAAGLDEWLEERDVMASYNTSNATTQLKLMTENEPNFEGETL